MDMDDWFLEQKLWLCSFKEGMISMLRKSSESGL